MIATLLEIMASAKASPRDRLEAAKIILDRTEGKAVERSINLNADASPALTESLGAFSPDQLVDFIRKIAVPELPAPAPAPITLEAVVDPVPDPELEPVADPEPEEQAARLAVDPDTAFDNLG